MRETPLSERTYRLLLGVALLLALGLRLWNYAAEPFWGDEILSLDIARHFAGHAGTMLEYLKETEVHPPLYYLLLQLWTPLFGAGEAGARLPSLLASLGLVWVSPWFARKLFSDGRIALAAAFAVALLPLQVQEAQEARPYAIVALLATLAAGAAWSYFRSEDRRWLFAYAGACALGVLFHYSFLFFLAAMIGWWMVEIAQAQASDRKRLCMAGLVAHFAVALAFAWWADALLYRIFLGGLPISGLPARFSQGAVAPETFARLLDGLVWTTKLHVLPRLEILAQLAFLAVASAAAVGAIRRAKPDAPVRPWAFLAWLALAPLALFVFSPASAEVTDLPERHLLFLTVPLAAALSALLVRLPKRQALLVAALFLASLLPRLADIMGNDATWDRQHRLGLVADRVDAEAKPGDLIVIAYANSRTDLDHYLRRDLEAVPLLPIAEGPFDAWRSRETLGLYEQEFQLRIAPIDDEAAADKLDRLVRQADAKRVWIVGWPPGHEGLYRPLQQAGWRPVYRSIWPLSPIDLFAKP